MKNEVAYDTFVLQLKGGGIGWSGAKTCVSGSVCTYSNPCKMMAFLVEGPRFTKR